MTTTDRERVRELHDTCCNCWAPGDPPTARNCHRYAAIASAYDSGLTAGRRIERAAVVAWLKDGEAGECPNDAQCPHHLAQLLELGAHLPTEDPADGE